MVTAGGGVGGWGVFFPCVGASCLLLVITVVRAEEKAPKPLVTGIDLEEEKKKKEEKEEKAKKEIEIASQIYNATTIGESHAIRTRRRCGRSFLGHM